MCVLDFTTNFVWSISPSNKKITRNCHTRIVVFV